MTLFVPVKYENHNGVSLNLTGDGLYMDPQALLEWEMKSNTSNNALTGFSPRISSTSIKCAAYRHPNAMKNRDLLYEIPDADLESDFPGRVWFGEWYKYFYMSASSIDKWRYSNGMALFDLTFTNTEDIYWYKDTTKFFTERYDQGTEGLDFPFDFPFDFGRGQSEVTVTNENFIPSDVLIRMYGPITTPRVTIGNNIYGITSSVDFDEYVEIDTREQTIVITRANGDKDNIFSDLYGTYEVGSGSYVFEKLPVGVSEVTWSGYFDFDITIRERRKIPRFEGLL